MYRTLYTLRLLLWSRWRQFVNTFWRGGIGRKMRLLLMIGGLLLGGALVAGFSGLIIGGLRAAASSDEIDLPGFEPLAVLHALPNVLLLGILLLSLVTSIGSALTSLFFSPALDRLMLAPIPTRAVVMATLFSVTINSWMLMVFVAIIPLAIYGISLGASVGYYLALPLVVLSIPLLPTTLGAMIAIGVVRIIPGKRLREILSVLSGMIGIFCYAGSQLLFSGQRGSSQVDTSWLLAVDQPWLPSSWAGNALNLVIEGQPVGWAILAGFLAGSAGIFFGAALLTERLFLVGWQTIAGGSSRKRQQPAAAWQGWKGAITSIFSKDLRLIRRDLRQLSQFLWIFVVLGIYVWRMQSSEGQDSFSALSILLFVLFMCSAISTNLAISAISREGRTYWLLHSAPVAARQIVLAKWLLAWLAFPGVGAAVLLITTLLGATPPALAAVGWLLICVIGSAVSAVEIAIGAAFPNLKWERPEQMQRGRSGCLGNLALWVVMLLVGGAYALALAPQLVQLVSGDPVAIPLLIRIGAGGAAVVLNLLVCWIGIVFASGRLAALEP